MASFEAIRERLPSLYRPEDDDLADGRLPLVAADIAEVVCEPQMEPRLITGDRRVGVELPGDGRVLGVRLAPGAGVSPTTVIAVFLPDALRPSTIARVRDGLADFPAAVARTRFTLELRRRGLLSSLLLGIGDELDDADREAALVMHAHWYGFADRARYSPFHLRRRRLAGEPPPGAHDPDLVRFPYIRDLARLAALLPVPTWQEQTLDPELVEAYRLRIARMIELYKQGLATLPALQRVIELELPIVLDGPAEERDRGLVLDEFAPLRREVLDVPVPGNPADTLAPLSHWTVESTGLAPATATAYIAGAGPGAERPALELYGERLALGYRGTLETDVRMLRLRPAFSSWLGRAAGVDRSRALPTDTADADPAAPGPWAPSDGAPTGTVTALLQTRDRILWAAVDDGSLVRYDGRAWKVAVTGLDTPHCLAETPDALLVGTAAGLSRVPLFPTEQFAAAEVDGVTGAVLAVAVDAGGWTLGTEQGLLRRTPEGTVSPAGLAGVAVRAIAADAMGGRLYGTDLGVFQHQPGLDHWYVYAGGSASEQDADWVRVPPGTLPAASVVFLPAVHAVHRGPDGSLWLGTEKGLARYFARTAARLAFTSVLEAYPDAGTGAVHAIARDAHGAIWFAGAAGLLRADRRDLWHFEAGAWRQLGRLDTLYDGPEPEPRGSWRFDRASGAWQRADPVRGWVPHTGEARIVPQDAVLAVTWTDDVAADTGVLAPGGEFSDSEPVAAADLVMRFKPSDERIVDGGVPALPRIPPGRSTWRYLSLEGEDEPPPPGRPTWTREGRRLSGEPAPAGIDDPPEPARFDIDPPAAKWGRSLTAFAPVAHVRLEWRPTQRLSVVARLRPRAPGESIEPAVLDRVFDGISQVRPAGVRAVLAVDETIVRGDDVGSVA
jgi:hypothetical protein